MYQITLYTLLDFSILLKRFIKCRFNCVNMLLTYYCRDIAKRRVAPLWNFPTPPSSKKHGPFRQWRSDKLSKPALPGAKWPPPNDLKKTRFKVRWLVSGAYGSLPVLEWLWKQRHQGADKRADSGYQKSKGASSLSWRSRFIWLDLVNPYGIENKSSPRRLINPGHWGGLEGSLVSDWTPVDECNILSQLRWRDWTVSTLLSAMTCLCYMKLQLDGVFDVLQTELAAVERAFE